MLPFPFSGQSMWSIQLFHYTKKPLTFSGKRPYVWWSIVHSTRTQHFLTGDRFGVVREVEIEHDPAILSHRISRFFLNCILNKAFVSYQLWFHHLSTMDGCGLHAA